MSPAPTARARPSPSCARSSKRRACACMSIPRRTSCASTSASASARRARACWSRTTSSRRCSRNASAPMPASRSRCSRSRPRPALLLFARHPADVLLLEVGLGGRLDATNVIDRPLATVVTPVSFDHADYLGDSVAKIAAEKAGILKRGVPAIVARAAARGAHRDRARRGACRRADQDRRARTGPRPRSAAAWSIRTTTACSTCRRRGWRGGISSRTRASPSRRCARCRRCALAPAGFEAVAKAEWPARMQRLSQGKLAGLLPAGSELWLDGGHNADGGRAVANALADLEERVSRPLVLIVGMLATKDAGAFLKNFSGLARRLIAVPIPDQPKSIPAGDDRRPRARGGHSGAGLQRRRERARRDRQARPRSAAAGDDHGIALSRRRGARRQRHAAGVMTLWLVMPALGAGIHV